MTTQSAKKQQKRRGVVINRKPNELPFIYYYPLNQHERLTLDLILKTVLRPGLDEDIDTIIDSLLQWAQGLDSDVIGSLHALKQHGSSLRILSDIDVNSFLNDLNDIRPNTIPEI